MKVKRVVYKYAIVVLFFLVLLETCSASINGISKDLIVNQIYIEGNLHIDTNLIYSAIIKTKVGGPVNSQYLVDDAISIYNLGYFSEVQPRVVPVQQGAIIIFELVENPVIESIVFTGANLDIHSYADKMQLKFGEVLNWNYLQDDMSQLPSWLSNNLDTSVFVDKVDLEDGIIYINVSNYFIQDIIIKGNQKTKDHVVSRELTIKPGDILARSEVDKSLRNIFMLGFFEEVESNFDLGNTQDNLVLTIDVKERKTGSADFGAGYSSRDGFFGYMDISDDNFLGNGQRANLYFELGKGKRTYKVGFYEPYILKGGTSLGGNVYRTNKEVEHKSMELDSIINGKEHTTGLDVTVGHPLGDYTRGSLTLRVEERDFSGELKNYLDPYRSLTFGGNIFTNTTDHPFAPTKGYKNNFILETGTGLFGGEAVYSKVALDHSRYYQLYREDIIFAVRGSGGRLLSGVFRENDKFRIGGSESLRGYSYGSDKLVGDKMLLMNAEVRYPIYDFVSGVVFADLGRAWEENESIDLSDMLNSYGLGLRIDTPLGLLRLDYGWGLDENNKRQGEFYFGVGHTF